MSYQVYAVGSSYIKYTAPVLYTALQIKHNNIGEKNKIKIKPWGLRATPWCGAVYAPWRHLQLNADDN